VVDSVFGLEHAAKASASSLHSNVLVSSAWKANVGVESFERLGGVEANVTPGGSVSIVQEYVTAVLLF